MEFNNVEKVLREERNVQHFTGENCGSDGACISEGDVENCDSNVVAHKLDEQVTVDSVKQENLDDMYIGIEENDCALDALSKCKNILISAETTDLDAPDETNTVNDVESSNLVLQDVTGNEAETTELCTCYDTNILVGLEASMLNVCDNINCPSGLETTVLDSCDETTKLDLHEDIDSVKDVDTTKLDDTKFVMDGNVMELVCGNTNSTTNTVNNSCERTSYQGPHKINEDTLSDTQGAEIMVDKEKSNESLNNMMESNGNEKTACKSTIRDQACSCDWDKYETAECEASSTFDSSVIEDLRKLKSEINNLPFVKTNSIDQHLPQESSSVIFQDNDKLTDKQDVDVLDHNIADEPYGLDILFSEDISIQSKNVKVKGGRSKAARKRKAQQQRLVSLLAQAKTKPSRRFARSFQELVRSPAEWENMELESDLICPVCLEMYHLPHACYPCSHMFCDPCLRRLTGRGVGGIPCPLCRTTIQACHLDRDFDEHLMLTHSDIYTARAMAERKTKFRHYKLPFTPSIPIGRQLLRHLVAARANQNTRGLSHDLFKVMAGCLFGVCVSMFIMRFSNVSSLDNAQYINIVFVSLLCGAGVTYLTFKVFQI